MTKYFFFICAENLSKTIEIIIIVLVEIERALSSFFDYDHCCTKRFKNHEKVRK